MYLLSSKGNYFSFESSCLKLFLSGAAFEDKQKQKIKEIIRKQKQEHERRVKTLEKLTKLERLHADKIKQMMFLNDITLSDTATTSMMSLSINDTTLRSEHCGTESLNGDKSRLSHVEVIDLANTTVVRPPNGYAVVKEKINTAKPKQTNELHADENGHIFVSIPNKTIVQQQNTTNEIAKKQSMAWFEPISAPAKRTSRVKHCSTPGFNTNSTAKQVEIKTSASVSTEQTQPKLSLQEAFEMFNFKFISKSRRRLNEMKSRVEKRRHDEELKRERLESIVLRNMTNERRSRLVGSGDNFYFAKKRQMTSLQIKEQTEKVYKKLPEVKEKIKQQKIENIKKHNRIKSSIYNKVCYHTGQVCIQFSLV
jgi:hypothetical protein